MKLHPNLASGCLFLLGLIFTPMPVAVDTTIWVGSTLDCDEGNLQTAINLASTSAEDTTIIRVAKASIANASLSILNRNVRLYGGYTACFDPVSNGATTLTGGAGSVILIAASDSERRYVRMRDFVVRDGDSTDDGYGGGIQIGGNVSVSITSSSVLGNQASYGGGISILGGTWQPSLSLSAQIGDYGDGNQATLGGGIYCQQADLFVASSTIRSNTAAWTGSGVHLSDCTLSSNGFPAGVNRISSNQAAFGGGIAALNGSAIKLGTLGDNGSEPGLGGRTVVFGNDATEHGGGLYLSGAETMADIDAAVFIVNTADEYGGAAYVTNGAEFRLARGEESAGMFPYDPYSTMEDNVGNAGGNVIYVDGGGSASIRKVLIREGGVIRPSENRGEDNVFVPSALHVDGDSSVSLSGVLMTGMHGEGMVLANGAYASVYASTVAGNEFDNDFRLLGNGSSLELDNSIIWDPLAILIADAALGVITQHNNNVHDDTALPGGSMTTDPGFVDADHENYRLRGNSINIDTYTTLLLPNSVDLDGAPRAIDLYPDQGGIIDRGAYELGDLIFANDFEDP